MPFDLSACKHESALDFFDVTYLVFFTGNIKSKKKVGRISHLVASLQFGCHVFETVCFLSKGYKAPFHTLKGDSYEHQYCVLAFHKFSNSYYAFTFTSSLIQPSAPSTVKCRIVSSPCKVRIFQTTFFILQKNSEPNYSFVSVWFVCIGTQLAFSQEKHSHVVGHMVRTSLVFPNVAKQHSIFKKTIHTQKLIHFVHLQSCPSTPD